MLAGDVEVYADDADVDVVGEIGVEDRGVVAAGEDFFDLVGCRVGGHNW